MSQEYQKQNAAPTGEALDEDGLPEGGLAVRRHTDRCFHEVEEVVKEGFIVAGVLFAHDEVAEVRRGGRGACGRGGSGGTGGAGGSGEKSTR